MRRSQLFILLGSVVVFGCRSQDAVSPVGFLSDYSKLERVSPAHYRYVAPDNPLARYSSFIVDSVALDWHEGSRIPRQLDAGKVTHAEMEDLAAYLRRAVISALAEEYAIAQQPAPGVARIRMALTDVQSATPRLGDDPRRGAGLGRAAMEAEILDSVTGEQIGAIVIISRGGSHGLTVLKDWSQPKVVMKQWATQFREYLDDAHTE